MDTLKNVSAVQNALAEYKTVMTSLTETISDLEKNKQNISSSWQSSNADSFLSQYEKLINSLREAYNNFSAYQAKIDSVVKEFIGFDTTIN